MKEPNISVAIMHGQEIKFELYGDYRCSKHKGKFNGKFSAAVQGGQIKISSEKNSFIVESGVIFNPTNIEGESFLLKDVVIGIQFHWEKKENQRFLGSLQFIIEHGELCAVNIIPVEQYLASVISSEMNATSSEELLKAHSIISRSWVLAQIEKGRELKKSAARYESKTQTEDELIRWYDREDHQNYDVCADDHCQRYQGITKIYAHAAQQAVEFTRGLIVSHEDKICDTRFSKCCGGATESFENVWEPVKHPYLQKVVDYKFPHDFDTDLRIENAAVRWIKNNPPAFCDTHDQKILKQVLLDYDQKTTDFYRWIVEYTQEQISEIIKFKSGIDFGKILDLIPLQRGESARLIKLKIVGSKRTMIIGKELEIRRVLSKTHLYSSAIVIEKENTQKDIPGKFVIRGAGWGHGVGLCQIGAAVMGEMGYGFDEILLHYFRGASIKRFYD